MHRRYVILLRCLLLVLLLGAFIAVLLLFRKPPTITADKPAQIPEATLSLSKVCAAENLLAQGKAPQAAAICREIIQPGTPGPVATEAYRCLIKALVAQDLKKEAMAALEEALNRGVKDFDFKCEASIALSDRLTASKPDRLRFKDVFSEEEVPKAWQKFAENKRIYLLAEATLQLKDNHAGEVISLLASPDPFVAKRSMDVMELFRPEAAIPPILKLADHPNAEVRMKVAKLMGRLRAKEQGLPLLRNYLSDENQGVRLAAVEAMDAMDAKSEEESLVPLLDDPSVDVRRAVAKALGKLKSTQSVSDLVQTATVPEVDRSLRCSAIKALDEMNARESAPSLLPLLHDPQDPIRYNAARALGHFGYKEAIPDLERLVKEKEGLSRAAAARALGDLDARECIPALIELLDDLESSVRESAVRSLGTLRATEAQNQLIAFLEVERSARNETVVWALGEIHSAKAVPSLVPLLQTPNHETRKEVIKALEKIGSPEAIQGLILALDDRSTVNVGLAVASLGKLGAKEAIPELEKLLDSHTIGLPEAVMDVLVEFDATQSVSRLIEVMVNPHGLGHAAAQTVRRMDQEEVGMKALVELIQSGKAGRHVWKKVEILASERTIPTILELSQDQDPRIRLPALEILRKNKAQETVVPETNTAP